MNNSPGIGSESENICLKRESVSLEVSVPFSIDEEKYKYFEGPGDIFKFRILLECIRDRSEEQQDIPLLWFCHGWSPMFVPVRCPQKSIHETITKPSVRVKRLWGKSHDQPGKVDHWITKRFRCRRRGKIGGAVTHEGNGGWPATYPKRESTPRYAARSAQSGLDSFFLRSQLQGNRTFARKVPPLLDAAPALKSTVSSNHRLKLVNKAHIEHVRSLSEPHCLVPSTLPALQKCCTV